MSSSTIQPIRIPVDSTQTKRVGNRNWNWRYQDGKHKPKAKK